MVHRIYQIGNVVGHYSRPIGRTAMLALLRKVGVDNHRIVGDILRLVGVALFVIVEFGGAIVVRHAGHGKSFQERDPLNGLPPSAVPIIANIDIPANARSPAIAALWKIAAVLPYPAAMKPYILAFGDSLTEGYGLASSDSFTAQLERLLQERHPLARVDNAGVSGDTTTSALARMPKVLSQLRVNPDLVIVELGANDLLRGIALQKTRANLDAILTELARCGLRTLLAQMEAPAFLGQFGRDCSAIYPDLAARHGASLAPFFPKGVLANPALTLRDRIHPNARGTAMIARAFMPAVEAALSTPIHRAA